MSSVRSLLYAYKEAWTEGRQLEDLNPAWRPDILAEVFCGFPQSLQANAEIVP
jgi:hypothetical protein